MASEKDAADRQGRTLRAAPTRAETAMNSTAAAAPALCSFAAPDPAGAPPR